MNNLKPKLISITLILTLLKFTSSQQVNPTVNTQSCQSSCAQCQLFNGALYATCNVCSGSKMAYDSSSDTYYCTGSPLVKCVYESAQTGIGKCNFCERGYSLSLSYGCQKFTKSGALDGCDHAYEDNSGIIGCYGCQSGYYMSVDYKCYKGVAVQYCETHGFSITDFSKTIVCKQCEDGYFLTSGGLCQRVPTKIQGCAVPDQSLNYCYYCDGYHGWLETNADANGLKICTRSGVNWGVTGPGAFGVNLILNFGVFLLFFYSLLR